MYYISHYSSPIGKLVLTSDENALHSISFECDSNSSPIIEREYKHCESAPLKAAKLWLDAYFRCEVPRVSVPISLCATEFQKDVLRLASTVPYGETLSYGDLARRIAVARQMRHISPQAVGTALGKNPVLIIIPCHRIIKANGDIGGYVGGEERKRFLLELESCSRIRKI